MRREVAGKLVERVEEVFPQLKGETIEVKIDEPPSEDMGDFSSNIAMQLARKLKNPPFKIAERILSGWEDPWFDRIEIAGPGFINFHVSLRGWREWISGVTANYDQLIPSMGRGKRVHLEFVSANPTGPLHIGHGRGAAVGDTIGRLLESTGFEVHREYYINDAGRQIKKLGESVYLRYRELFGEEVTLEDDHYRGDYIVEIAKEIAQQYGDRFLSEEDPVFFEKYAVDKILTEIKDDLRYFRIEFDNWFSEKTLYERGEVEMTMEILKEKDLVYEKDGALWFKSSLFGDEKDRVLIRSTGDPTYFFADISYHRLKFEGGYDLIIDLWGADHHGYEPRIRAALKALGFDDDQLKIIFIQLVSLIRNGEIVPMSTRAGEFITLREVLDEVGVDAARFFFLLRRGDSHLDFDIDLAKEQSSENPVYYVQYAHARIASIFRQGEKKGYRVNDLRFHPGKITEREVALLKKVDQFTDILEASVRDLSPHRIPFYLVELARQFHQYYNEVRILVEDEEERETKLYLLDLVKWLIKRGLNILGVNAPEKM